VRTKKMGMYMYSYLDIEVCARVDDSHDSSGCECELQLSRGIVCDHAKGCVEVHSNALLTIHLQHTSLFQRCRASCGLIDTNSSCMYACRKVFVLKITCANKRNSGKSLCHRIA
jgi:hypothetical protein